jgi:uncharacterized repeat protein (TIGR01451 family)
VRLIPISAHIFHLVSSVSLKLGRLSIIPCFLALLCCSLPAFAITPAHTVIQNQATATYIWSGRDYGIASNAVRNPVAPAYGILLTPDGTVDAPGLTAYAEPGQSVYLPYVLTNTGNVTDSYELSLKFLQGSFLPLQKKIYHDLNGNGRVDAGEPEVTRIDLLPAGEQAQLIVSLTVPASAAYGQEVYHDVIGKSVGDPSLVDELNVNRVELLRDALLKITKTPSVAQVVPGDEIDFSLSVINNGSLQAKPERVLVDGVERQGILVADLLPGIAEGEISYVAGSLSGAPAGQLRLFRLIGSDLWRQLSVTEEEYMASQVSEIGMLFEGGSGLLVPGQQAQVNFRLAVAADHPAKQIQNISRVHYRSQTDQPRQDSATNTVQVTVLPKSTDVLIGPYNLPDAVGNVFGGSVDNNGDATYDPGVPVTEPNPYGTQITGNMVYFLNTVRNDANAVDVINLSIDEEKSNLPASWMPYVRIMAVSGIVPRMEADGSTPFLHPETGEALFAPSNVSTLFDSNGDGIPDTGPLAPGATYTVAVRLIIPEDALSDSGNKGTRSGGLGDGFADNDGQGYRVSVRARSTLDASKSNLTSNIVRRIMAPGNFWDPFIKDHNAPETITIGTTIPYINIFGNNGPGPVYNTIIRDELSNYLTNVQSITNGVIYDSKGGGRSITVTGRYEASTHNVVWHIFEIPPGFEGRIGFSADVAPGTADGTEIPNVFSITSDQTASVRLSNEVLAVVGGEHILSIDKKVGTDKVDKGDPLRYEVTVHNKGKEALTNAQLNDLLPRGFRYLSGTARIDGQKVEPQISADGSTLRWSLGTLAANSSVSIVYACVVTMDARLGQNTNEVTVSAILPQGSRLEASSGVDVTVEAGMFHNDSIIFGRVFVDQNDDRVQNYAEPGIQGVRLILEDGTYVLTDREGKYHFTGIKPGMHVLRLDETSLPPGLKVAIIDSQNALNPLSRMVELRYGTPHKANFRVLPLKKEKAADDAKAAEQPGVGLPGAGLPAEGGAAVESADATQLVPAGAAATGAGQTSSQTASAAAADNVLRAVRVSADGFATRLEVECAQELDAEAAYDEASGILHVLLPGVAKSEQLERQALDDPNVASLRSYIDDDGERAKLQVRLRKRSSGYPVVSHERTEKGLLISVGLREQQADFDPAPQSRKAAALPAGHEFEPLILSPEQDESFISSNQISVSTAFFLAGKASLYINGEPVPEDRIGQRSVEVTARRMSVLYYGINLIPGTNVLRLEVLNPGEAAPRVHEISIQRAAAPAKIALSVSPSNLMADSLTEPQLRIVLLDKQGLPTGHGSVVTVTVDKGDILSPDLRITEPGHQAQVRDGMAIIRLSAASSPESRLLRVIAGDLDQSIKVTFAPHQRSWILSGIASASVTDRHRQESGRDGGRSSQKVDMENRIALFAKGTLPYNMVMTTAYDSKKPRDDGKIYGEQDPLKYYPVYGDESEQQYEAESRDKVYVKVEKDQSYLMYGDFDTGLDKAQLAAYQRSMTGAKLHAESKYVDLDAFFSRNDQVQIKGLEIRGRGVSGYYTLPDKNIVINSERVVIETRDRWHPKEVLKSESKTRFTDYSIDYDTGRILFKRPVLSKDSDNNPIFIVVDYEVDSFKSKDYNSYGGRAELHNAERTMAVGVTQIRDESSPKDHVIEGVDASIELRPGLVLSGELAQSSSVDGSEGSAMRIDLEGEHERARYRVYYRNIGTDFDNQSMSGDRSGHLSLGFEGEFDYTERWSSKEEFYTENDRGSDRRRYVGIHDFIYKRDSQEFTLGFGYTEEEDTARGPSKGERLRSPFGRVGTAFNLSQSLRLELFHQQAFGDSDTDQGTRSSADLRYTLNRYADLVLGAERRDIPTAGAEYNVSLGIEAKLDESTSAFNRLKLEDSASGRRVLSGTGLDIKHQLNSEWRLGGTAELSHAVRKSRGASDDDFWALGLSSEYRPLSGEGTAVSRYEMRYEDTEISYLAELGGTLKVGLDYTLFGRNIVNYIMAKDDRSDSLSLDLLLGCAFRPVNWDWLNVIGDVEFKHEKDNDVSDWGRLSRLIFSVEAHWQPCNRLVLESKYACKSTSADYLDSALFSDVKALGVRVDITDRVFVSLGGRVLSQYDVSAHSLSYGASIGFNVVKDLQLAFGYNFEGFEDRDFSRGERWDRGFFIALHWKFDESIFGILNRMEGSKDKE